MRMFGESNHPQKLFKSFLKSKVIKQLTKYQSNKLQLIINLELTND